MIYQKSPSTTELGQSDKNSNIRNIGFIVKRASLANTTMCRVIKWQLTYICNQRRAFIFCLHCFASGNDTDIFSCSYRSSRRWRIWITDILVPCFFFSDMITVALLSVNFLLNCGVTRVYLWQALFFTGFWTTPTNGFGRFLSLEKKSLSLG